MNEQIENVDATEVAKFEALGGHWWDRDGDFKPLHDINPLRAGYIDQRAPVAGKRLLDVGCGGGILAEEMARRGAIVTGIDAGESPLAAARRHLAESGLEVDYRLHTAEGLAAEQPGAFDVVSCLELLEHVPDPASVIRACARLVRPGGDVFFSTINRNPKAYLLAVIGAEYVLGMLPKGTHDYSKFIRPSELDAWTRKADLTLKEITGMTYNPLTRAYRLDDDVDVNYLAWVQPA